jgi:UPF0271 protein
MVVVDLNADLGEADVLTPEDAGVLDAVTSVSIACGFHAGSRKVMRDTARACVARGVAIGAHVSFRDSEGFGRRARDVAPAQLIDDIIEQCATLLEEVGSAGGTVAYVKPHGALYHQMSADAVVATSVVSAVSRLAIGTLLTQAGSEAIAAAHRSGLRVVLEGFPDRGYLVNGRLAPRHRAGAVVDDPAHVADRAVSLVHRGGIEAMSLAFRTSGERFLGGLMGHTFSGRRQSVGLRGGPGPDSGVGRGWVGTPGRSCRHA